VGYRRFDTTIELRLLNEIYAVLRLYKNFCLPTIRLKSKTRVEGRIKREYDQPRTPYQRLLDSRQIGRNARRELKAIYESLNPAALQRRLTQLREQTGAGECGQIGVQWKTAPPRARHSHRQKRSHTRCCMTRTTGRGAAPLRPRKPSYEGRKV